MADNKTVVFTGALRWANVPPRKPRPPYEVDDTNKYDLSYSIEVECSEDRFKKLKKAGIPKFTELREDEETGKTYIRLRASKQKTKTKQEHIDKYGPEPFVFDDVEVVDAYGKPVTDSIANGSEGEVTAEVAPNYKGGVVLRLRKVVVTKLEVYDPDAKEEKLKKENKVSVEDLNDIF